MNDLFNIKRILPSPFNFTGSKYKLMPVLKSFIPDDYKCVYDLFCGGGSFFINSGISTVYANDIIKPLIEFYLFLQNNEWGKVIEQIYSHNIDKNQNEYNELRNRFNQNKNCIDFYILCCSCTNNMMRFNKKFEFNQTWGNRHFNKNIENKLCGYHNCIFNNTNYHFANISFEKAVIDQDKCLVYLDPPYLITEAGYNCYWSLDLEKQLYNYLDKLHSDNIKFLMSNVLFHKGKNNPFYDRIKKYDIINIKGNYNKVSRAGQSDSQEIVVKNY